MLEHKRGDRVGSGPPTLSRVTSIRDCIPHRVPGAHGRIHRRMTSGDLYYEVRHHDGTVAAYDAVELTPVPS